MGAIDWKVCWKTDQLLRLLLWLSSSLSLFLFPDLGVWILLIVVVTMTVVA
jgi:hypothetical protein